MARSISDDAVRAKTGKTWEEWFSTLDRAGAKKLSHREIAAWLSKRGMPGWWAQMVTVGYERARRARPVGQTTTGWQVSVQKTGVTGEVRAVRAPGLLRLSWVSGEGARSTLEITLSAQKGGKTALRFRHHGIATAAERAELRERWKAGVVYFSTRCAN